MQAINDGIKKVSQMEFFNDSKFLYLHDAKLDYNWIATQGKKIQVLANDLIFLSLKMSLIDHDVDKELRSKMFKLMENFDQDMGHVKEKKDKFLERQNTPVEDVNEMKN